MLYEIVDLSQMKSDSEVDGETLDNPWATDGPSTANTDQHCNGNGAALQSTSIMVYGLWRSHSKHALFLMVVQLYI